MISHTTRSLATCLVASAAFLASAWGADPSKLDQPNFIVINIDDLGYGDIEPFGSKLNRTPNLNRMAKEGRKLTCFYAAPVCSPSRASLLTGCYPKRVLPIPHVFFPSNATGLDPGELTIAELLKEQGYATGIIGKWHLGDQPPFLPTEQGFDYYFGLPYSNDMGPAADGIKSNLGKPLPTRRRNGRGQPPLPLMRNATVLQRVLPDDQQAIVQRYTEEAVQFIWDHCDKPFFLYLPHSAVHFPLYPGKAFHGKSQNGLFGDWVEEVDWSVGQILHTVRQLNLTRKTMVIFTSDNGGAPRHGAVNAPLRGGKGSTFEGGMRVPTIAWWPQQIPADSQSAAVTGMMDILPTLVQLAGGTVPTDRTIDGRDIWPVLTAEADVPTLHETFFYYRGLNLQAVRQGPWKLHLAKGELYHLENDIAEAVNMAELQPEVVAQLRQMAEQTADDLGMTGIGPGCRPLGKVENPQPLINHEGIVRDGLQVQVPQAGMGILIGEVTTKSALAQVRLTQSDRLVDGDLAGIPGVVTFVVEGGGQQQILGPIDAVADHDFIARTAVENLQPNTQYTISTQLGTTPDNMRPGPTATFRTHAGGDQPAPVRFVVVTGMNYAKFHGDNRINRELHLEQNNTNLPAPYRQPDKHLGYPALATIQRMHPDFFVGTGDNVYYDTPKTPRADSLPQMRRKWHEQFIQPRYHDLFARVPTYWMVDDHDYRVDDCDNSGDYLPSPETARQVMLEQLPYGPHQSDTKTYRTFRVSRDVQIWLPENRLFRSPNAQPDGADKTIWGADQKRWLKETLAESDATFKLLISPTPLIGPDDLRKKDNHSDIGGFRHERDTFFAWLKEENLADNFYIVCGDRHWQYHSLAPSGFEEFSCGALIDANSRPGRQPGDPKSTDPEGLIQQPYSQQTPSGGFLWIEAEPANATGPARLTFRFHDELGNVLYEHSKTVERE